jgi:acetate CoA/acetoacetate CoA-transferase alpha subunit
MKEGDFMAKAKKITKTEVASLFKDGMTIMIGGFMTNGTAETLVDAVVESGVKDLTVICNDAGLPGKGCGKLLDSGQIKKLIASHVGLNKKCGKLYSAGELELVLTPQGTLAEQVRSGGAGLGGFLTPTGVGTIVAEGKQVLEVDGREYILELPLRADIALIKGYQVDQVGNIRYRGSTRNFNPMMATAADTVIVEADELVEAGAIGPDYVETSYIFVDYILEGGAAK